MGVNAMHRYKHVRPREPSLSNTQELEHVGHQVGKALHYHRAEVSPSPLCQYSEVSHEAIAFDANHWPWMALMSKHGSLSASLSMARTFSLLSWSLLVGNGGHSKDGVKQDSYDVLSGLHDSDEAGSDNDKVSYKPHSSLLVKPRLG